MKTVIEMAREAGAVFPADGSYHKFEFEGSLERFADLVRADEREAYAHLAEKLTWADNKGVASAIRAQQALDKMAENARELGLDYEPAQEPVAYLCENAVGHKYFRWKKPSSTYKPVALYTTPPAQRTWVGLTDEEIDDIYQGVGKNDLMLVREVEAKLKEKNT